MDPLSSSTEEGMLIQAIEEEINWEKLPKRLKLFLRTETEWNARVKDYCIKKRYKWTDCLAKVACRESEYYEELMRVLRKGLSLFPYHLADTVCRVMRISPFKYYVDVIYEVLKTERSYDNIPNFAAADALRITGIGRNEFIEIMNKCKAKRLMWKLNKSLAREFLPTEPKDFEIQPWWHVVVVNLSLEEYRKLTPEELYVVDRVEKDKANMVAEYDLAVLRGLHRRGLIYFDVPVYPDDRFSVPSLEGFISNRDQTYDDPTEELLYNVFVASSSRTTVAELAATLQAKQSQLESAVSLACRVGFAKKILDPGDILGGHMPRGGGVLPSPPESPTKQGQLGGASELSEGSDVGEGVLSPAPVNRFALMVDANLTSYLMMGSLSRGLKSHAVTLFEAGKLGDASVAEIIQDLQSVEGTRLEGELQRFADHAFSLRVVLQCLRQGSLDDSVMHSPKAYRIQQRDKDNLGKGQDLPEPATDLAEKAAVDLAEQADLTEPASADSAEPSIADSAAPAIADSAEPASADVATADLEKPASIDLAEPGTADLAEPADLADALRTDLSDSPNVTGLAKDSLLNELPEVSTRNDTEAATTFTFLRSISSRTPDKPPPIRTPDNDHPPPPIRTTSPGPSQPKPGLFEVELLRCESLAGLKPTTLQNLLRRDYSVLVSMIPLASAPPIVPPPVHFGPPSPAFNTPWMKLLLYTVSKCGPVSLVLVRGQRMRALPEELRRCARAQVWAWDGQGVAGTGSRGGEGSLVEGSVLLHVLNSLLRHSAVLVQPLPKGIEGRPATVDVPLPLNAPPSSGGTHEPDLQQHPGLRRLSAELGLQTLGYIRMVNIPQTDRKPPKPELASLLSFSNWEAEGGTVKEPPSASSGSLEQQWVLQTVEFGVPLFDTSLCMKVCEGAVQAKLFEQSNLERHRNAMQELRKRLARFNADYKANGRLASAWYSAEAGNTPVVIATPVASDSTTNTASTQASGSLLEDDGDGTDLPQPGVNLIFDGESLSPLDLSTYLQGRMPAALIAQVATPSDGYSRRVSTT